MKDLSLKMDDEVFQETEKIPTKAVKFYNELQKRRILANQLQKESKLVRDESMKILEEFESLENED